MKTTPLWIYFGANGVLCVSLSIGISWYGQMVHRALPGSLLPLPTQALISCRLLLYAVPLPSLFIAVWFSVKGGLEAQHTQVVGAYLFLVLVLLICISSLAVMIPFLPIGIMLK